ncbi:MAG: DUF1743 domain-containing protein, partial [Nitrosopumilaceae archaeon]|nr:DUF1743 domain-containing protein [Nitrosopumilaceae archaeon]NIU87949.1 DUF1743 domain-containing protein [Nitrosopumilaceae archaeon]NIV66220.1 DUF1743 domain-containing protein [Nitrosopumilaceae archaeon]NIX62453.1 DUF1743 domain-containing protein [Nitrosopumilaceae archaeon]
MITKFVTEYSDTKNGANPGLVFFEGDNIPETFRKFSQLALWQLISRTKAKSFVRRKEHNLEHFSLGNGQGLVGAIGVIGYDFFEDHTLELLSYRKESMFGKKRRIRTESVKKMQEQTFPFTY